MEQQTWVTLLGFAGFGLALMGYLASMKRELKSEIGGVRIELHDTRTELKGDIADLRTELKGDIADLRTELKGDIADLRTELKGDIADLRADLKADIGRLDSRMVTLENRTYDISARLPPAPATAAAPRLVTGASD